MHYERMGYPTIPTLLMFVYNQCLVLWTYWYPLVLFQFNTPNGNKVWFKDIIQKDTPFWLLQTKAYSYTSLSKLWTWIDHAFQELTFWNENRMNKSHLRILTGHVNKSFCINYMIAKSILWKCCHHILLLFTVAILKQIVQMTRIIS